MALQIIAGLVLLPICGFSSYNSAVEVTLKDGRSILSNCSKLTGQTRTSLLTAGVDPDLIDLLYQCLAEDHNDIPKLIDLALYVRKQIVEKG